jgi:hypothetical protein
MWSDFKVQIGLFAVVIGWKGDYQMLREVSIFYNINSWSLPQTLSDTRGIESQGLHLVMREWHYPFAEHRNRKNLTIYAVTSHVPSRLPDRSRPV